MIDNNKQDLKTQNIKLNLLKKVLAPRFPEKAYSIGGYKECAVCMEIVSMEIASMEIVSIGALCNSINCRWTVYNGERGQRYDEIYCDTWHDACHTLFSRLTHDDAMISDMMEEVRQYEHT